MIVRDTCLGAHRALLGMNVITECWEELFKARPTPLAPGEEKREWDRIVADCRRVRMADAQRNRESVGRVVCCYALSIPAQSEAIIWARLPSQLHRNGSWWSLHSDCQAVEVARGLASVRRGWVAVRLRNTNPYAVDLNRHQRLARVTIVSPQQVHKEGELRFCQVGPTVVEVALAQTESPASRKEEALQAHLA